MNTPALQCPVCLTPLAVSSGGKDAPIVCLRCGTFSINKDAERALASLSDEPSRRLLSGWIRRASWSGDIKLDARAADFLLLRAAEKAPQERPTSLIHYASMAKDGLSLEGWAAVMFASDGTRALSTIKDLEDQGLLTSERRGDDIILRKTEASAELIERDDDVEPTAVVTPYQAFQLHELKVDRVKCFAPDQRIVFGDDGTHTNWTILIGDNGVGKTTILQLVAALWPGTEAVDGNTAPALQFRSDLKNAFQPSYSSEGYARAEAVFRTTTSDGTRHLLTGASIGSPIHNIFLDIGLGFDRINLTAGRSGMTYTGNFDLTGRPFIAGYGATRVVGTTSLARKDRYDENVTSLFDQEQLLRNPEEWILQADYVRHLSPDDKQAALRFHRIREALLTILPGVSDISIRPPREDSSDTTVLFSTDLGNVAYRELGLGYQSTIAWIIDLASRLFSHYPESLDPLSGQGLVLIDEIDLHLHPSWQRDLLGNLCRIFPNIKFIATTHSPLVVQGAGNARIYLLQKEAGIVRIIEETGEVENWRIDQILTSDLFGLNSARSKRVSALEMRRSEILSKPVMSAADRAEVDKLEHDIGDLPVGETQDDREAMAFLREVARKMRGA